MDSVKVSGIVVREAPMGEKDKRIVLLTREQGKLSVIAKGALNPKSRFCALSGLFCCGKYELTKGKTFYYISDAELLESYYELRSDLDALSVASAIVDVAAEVSLDGVENNALLNLTLRALNALKNKANPYNTGALFFWRVMCDNGLMPNMEVCPICGFDLENPNDSEILGFRMQEGDFICPYCSKTNIASARLSGKSFKVFKEAVSMSDDKLFKLMLPKEEQEAMLRLAIQYLVLHTGRDYRAIRFLLNKQ